MPAPPPPFDITPEWPERALHQLLGAIVESSIDALVSKSTAGIILSWNPAAEKLFGYSRSEAVGRHISLIIPFDRLYEEDLIIARLLAGQGISRLETQRRHKDGHLIPVELTISPIKNENGQVIGASKVARDLTELRAAQERERRFREASEEYSARFRAIFEQGPSLAAILTLDGSILDVNKSAWADWGLVREHLVGTAFDAGPWWAMPPDTRTRLGDAIAAGAKGESFRGLQRARRLDGELRTLDVSIVPIRDEHQHVIQLAAQGVDITDRERAAAALRENESRFRTLADNMSQLAWMADSVGSIFWYNRRWFDYTGTTLDEMKGWGWTSVHHPDHLERVVERIQHSWDTGELWEDLFPLRSHAGEYRWFLSRATPIRDASGAIVRWFGTNTDVTEQRQLEDELRRTTAQLEELNRRKDEFIATLAHELRNPLGAVRTSVSVLRSPNLATRALQDTHAIMERQVAQITRLLADLLDVSRITRGHVTLQQRTSDLREVVTDAVAVAAPVFAEAGVTLVTQITTASLLARADAARVQQMIDNILSNAAKYTPRGGRVTLSVDSSEADFVVTVADNGIGIEPTELPRVFEMFVTARDEPSRSKGGLGIGLCLVKQLAILHGGEVVAHSLGPGHGSTFVLSLPVLIADAVRQDSAPTPSAGESAVEPGGPDARRVLIIDDNQDNAEALSTLLQLHGCSTAVAIDGPSAIACAHEFHPVVVLLDLGLPDMDGFEVCRRLKALPGQKPYVAALTGWGQAKDRKRSHHAGFDCHLVKPADPRAILKLVDSRARR